MVEDYSQALEDNVAAIELDPYFVKAFVRAIKCLVALGQLDRIDSLIRSADGRILGSFDVQNEVRLPFGFVFQFIN